MIGRLGISYERDASAGLIAYAPRSGLFFAIHESSVQEAEKWLQGADVTLTGPMEQLLASAQGSGAASLAISSGSLLPDRLAWENPPQPSKPFVINWLLTGRCPLHCVYCYAEDLMHDEAIEPSREQVQRIAKTILSYRPVVVVLTGGDPLSSPHLELAISNLAGRCAVVVDTNGVHLTDERVQLFKKFGLMVRVSLDGESPALSVRQRPNCSGGDSSAAAVDAVCRCLRAEIPVTVQTVATRANLANLHRFGDKLHQMGVPMWRVLRVVGSRDRMDGYYQAIGGSTQLAIDRFAENWKHFTLEVLGPRTRKWADSMAVQATGSELRNSVVLVAPDGRFYTESATRNEKQLLDTSSPYRPALRSIRRQVDMAGHSRRYLRLEG